MIDSPIEEIKSRINILEVLADYVQLKKAGTNFKAVCPFHAEKSPSFVVSPSKQIWHCFGCGLGGDVFEFVKQAENIDFSQALKILADRAGVELKKPTKEYIQQEEQKDVLYDINDDAKNYYVKVLWESNAGKPALDYLKKRGLTDQTIKNWGLGYAPDDFHYLEKFLAKKYKKDEIFSAGLIVKKEDGTYFDRFRGRIMFPIINLHGQTVGFTGRILADKKDLPAGRQEQAKYVNSPETPIYNKSRVLYGLFQSKNAIRKENRVLLVEGNMDVISCHQAGTTIAVASSGTALTNDQLLILRRFTENLIFAFDSDNAGSVATRKALELALNLGLNVKIVELKDAKDPDELIKKGLGTWKKSVDTAPQFLDFYFSEILAKLDIASVEGKRQAAKDLLPLIYRISDPVTKAHYIRKLSSGLDIAETAIWDMIKKLGSPKVEKPKVYSSVKKSRKQILCEILLGLSLNLKNSKILAEFEVSDFNEDLRKLFSIIKQGVVDIGTIKNQDIKAGEIAELTSFAAQVEVTEQGYKPEEELDKISAELKKLIVKEKMEKISSELLAAEKRKDADLTKNLSIEFSNLTKLLKKL